MDSPSTSLPSNSSPCISTHLSNNFSTPSVSSKPTLAEVNDDDDDSEPFETSPNVSHASPFRRPGPDYESESMPKTPLINRHSTPFAHRTNALFDDGSAAATALTPGLASDPVTALRSSLQNGGGFHMSIPETRNDLPSRFDKIMGTQQRSFPFSHFPDPIDDWEGAFLKKSYMPSSKSSLQSSESEYWSLDKQEAWLHASNDSGYKTEIVPNPVALYPGWGTNEQMPCIWSIC